MESEFPSNNYKGKAKPAAEPDEKKIERVTEGEVIRRKKPLGKRLREMFIGGDASSVWSYVVLEVFVPAARDMMADMATQGVERMVFGEARSTSRRTGLGPRTTSGYTSYNRYAQQPRQEPRADLSRRARANHDFDEIILATRGEAQEVLDRLFDLVARYETATVADLYELVGVTGSYTDDKWGWTDIRDADIKRVSHGYLLDLPKPEPIR
jgi:hypothetical protein